MKFPDLKGLWIKVKRPPKREPYTYDDDFVWDVSDVEDLHHCTGCKCYEEMDRVVEEIRNGKK